MEMMRESAYRTIQIYRLLFIIPESMDDEPLSNPQRILQFSMDQSKLQGDIQEDLILTNRRFSRFHHH